MSAIGGLLAGRRHVTPAPRGRVDGIVAVALTVGAVWAVTTLRHDSTVAVTLVSAVLCTTAVAWRRFEPLPAALVALTAVAAYQISGHDTQGAFVTVAIVLTCYLVGRAATKRRQLAVAAGYALAAMTRCQHRRRFLDRRRPADLDTARGGTDRRRRLRRAARRIGARTRRRSGAHARRTRSGRGTRGRRGTHPCRARTARRRVALRQRDGDSSRCGKAACHIGRDDCSRGYARRGVIRTGRARRSASRCRCAPPRRRRDGHRHARPRPSAATRRARTGSRQRRPTASRRQRNVARRPGPRRVPHRSRGADERAQTRAGRAVTISVSVAADEVQHRRRGHRPGHDRTGRRLRARARGDARAGSLARRRGRCRPEVSWWFRSACPTTARRTACPHGRKRRHRDRCSAPTWAPLAQLAAGTRRRGRSARVRRRRRHAFLAPSERGRRPRAVRQRVRACRVLHSAQSTRRPRRY